MYVLKFSTSLFYPLLYILQRYIDIVEEEMSKCNLMQTRIIEDEQAICNHPGCLHVMNIDARVKTEGNSAKVKTSPNYYLIKMSYIIMKL